MLKKQLMKTTTTTLFLCWFFVFQSFDQVIGQGCTDSYPTCSQWKSLCSTMASVRSACSKTCETCVSGEGWSKWRRWSECSVSCGGGTQTRTRDCMGATADCPGDNTKERECNNKACPTNGDCKDTAPWCEEYDSYCSTPYVKNLCKSTCEDCDGGTSTAWTEWTGWTTCSVTCGVGIEERTRTCQDRSCPGVDYESQDCEGGECQGEWSDWSDWGVCSLSCGGGTQVKTRACVGSGCQGKNSETRPCETQDCDSGGGGDCKDIAGWCKQYKNYCPTDDYVKRNCMKSCEACSSGNFRWSDWTAWSCDVTCGTGMETRTRECQTGDCEGDAVETQSCTQDICPPVGTGYGPWTEYGTCSNECGGGVHSRTRTCLSGRCTNHSTKMKNCNEQECANSAPVTGSKFTRLLNSNWPGDCKDIASWCKGYKNYCPTDDYVKRNCMKSCEACSSDNFRWSDWTAWSCDVTCGTGMETRTRECQKGDCEGDAIETQSCTQDTCQPAWANWGSWSDCSPSCGPGKRTRSRTCSVEGQCAGLATSEMDCKLKDCEVAKWNDWGVWSECTKSCGAGRKTRSRTCSIPGECGNLPGASEEGEDCNTDNCPEWNEWSEWSECTKTCGVGKRKRIRTCSISGQCGSLPGESEIEENCNTLTCPGWKAWGPWAECSKTCDTGKKERVRTCSIANGCDGNSKETLDCNTSPCEDITTWSTCSRSCGGGTSKRFRSETWQFRACGDGPCPQVSCSALNSALRNKYGPDKSKCCSKVHMPSGETCGTNEDERRIIGGVDADKKRWPWTTGLYSNGKGFCGGTLISSKFVISAAHCFAEDNGLPFNIKGWQWILGTLDLKEQRKYEAIKTATVHPDYSYPYHDIAITEFAEPVKFDNFIYPLCLPHGEETPFDSLCYVVGWGVSTIPDQVTHHLQQAAIHCFDPRVCIDAYGKHSSLRQHLPYLKNNKGYLCAGSLTSEVDSCSGDSGGPLLCQRCDSCSWYLAGVVSFGPNPCALKGVPAIYTKVVHYEDWIYKVTGITKHNIQCKSAA